MKQKLVIALMVCSLLPPQFCWANEASETLEKIIQIVKDKVEIPKELTEFYYKQYDGVFHLTWNSLESAESIDITCTQEGNLLSYYHFTEDAINNKVACIDANEAKEIAEAFLSKSVPEYAQDLECVNWQIPSKGESYDLSFSLTHEGIPVYDHSANVSVNKQTGEIESFDGFKFDAAAKYDEAVPILSLEKAQALYLSEIGLSLGYRIYWGDHNKQEAFLAYYLENKEEGIHARTGKKVQGYIEKVDVYDAGVKEATTEGVAVNTQDLSPAELQAVESTKGYMTPEAIQKKLSTYFPALVSMDIFSTRIRNDSSGAYRFMEMGIKENDEIIANVNLSCDAQTGEVNYYNYYQQSKENKGTGEKWTKEEAQAFIQKVSPEKSKEIVFKSEALNDYDKNEQVFKFTRVYDGVAVYGDGIVLTYDTNLKQVTHYNVDWETDIDFPSHKGVLSEVEMVQKIGLTLYYMQTGEHAYSLVYAANKENKLFDAWSGKPVNWQGKEKEEVSSLFYTDIKGHKAEEMITRLYNSGIYLEGPTLKPDEAITQQELMRLLEQMISCFRDDASIYEIALEQKIIIEDEKMPEKQLTREEGIKYIINTTPYQKLAMQSVLYQYPYEDKDISEDLKGYVTVAYGLNILDPQSKHFQPKAKLTKADAMVMIYHLLQNN